MNKSDYFLSFIYICLFLVACDGGGSSEPLQYPEESSAIESSAVFSSEKGSSVAESSSSSETQSSSSTTFHCIIGTEEDCEYGTLIDERDGQTYKTMKIGDQEWMAENLNYNIGVKHCNHDSCAKYGRLYLWSTAMDSTGIFSTNGLGCGDGRMCAPDYPVRGICPAGWRLPDTSEMDLLVPELERLREIAAQEKDTSTEVAFAKRFLVHTRLWSSIEEYDRGAFFLEFDEESHSIHHFSCLKANYVNVRCVRGQNAEQNMNKKLSSSSQSSSSSENNSSSSLFISFGIMIDERDGQTYKTMTIGGKYYNSFIPKQTWMVENLNYAYLQPTSTLDSSSWCYDNMPKNCEAFGRLYIWSAAIDSSRLYDYDPNVTQYVQGICPDGWHLPTYAEDMALIPWRYCCDGEDGFNYEKSVAGIYYTEENRFLYIDEFFTFWLSKDNNDGLAQADILDSYSLAYSEGHSFSEAIHYESKRNAISIRCVKDDPDTE